MILAPNDPRHGTLNGYTRHRCRCDECTAVNTVYLRGWRDRQDGLPPGDPRHGTLNGYDNFSCRCTSCKDCKQARNRRRYSRYSR